jgi:hypothetical protein
MKKIFVLFSILFIGISFSAIAKQVEIINARLAAKNLYYELVNRHDAVPYESIAITSEFIEKYNDQPVYYVFNINNTKGFVIVAADDGCYPILGFSFESSYSTENQPEGFSFWMNNRKQEIASNIQSNLKADDNSAAEWQRLLSTDINQLNKETRGVMDVAPLISSLWDQGFPYNSMCPEEADCGAYGGHVTVGCVATAMVQIMYYWRWPNQGQGSHTDSHTNYGTLYADFGNTTYEWNGMNNQPNKECDPVALISYHAGIAVNMFYNQDGQCSSGAYTSTVPIALKNYFKYASTCQSVQKQYYTTANWNTLLQDDLVAGKPVQYGGNGSGGGHSWVCDGFMATNYYHMNWGWSGNSNGYFYLNNLNPGGYTFNNNQEAVVHITPDPALYPTYCTGQTDVIANNFGTIEDGSGPLADYSNNANCSWLIAPDDSIQTVTLTFGKFDIASGDEVKVYDGSNASATLIGSYSGSTAPSAITSTGPALFVTFTSNGSGTAQGFLASYNTSQVAFCQSSTTLTEPSGNISDGSERFSYRNTSSCKWKIMPANASSVTLSFSNFKTQQDKDKVQIYDLNPPGTLLAAYSGDYSTTPPASVTSPSGKMLIVFTSDATIRDEGWDASYSITVGAPDKKTFGNLEIFPNPTNDFLNIRFSINESQSVKLDLVSMKGEMIYSQSLGNFKGDFERQIDLSSLTRGIYFLRITSDQGTTTTKVVVQ